MLKHREKITKEMESLNGFRDSIKANHAKIDQKVHEVDQLLAKNDQVITDFMKSDMFVHVSRNYTTVHKKLARFNQVLENEFRPEIDKVRIDKTLFVKKSAFEKVK